MSLIGSVGERVAMFGVLVVCVALFAAVFLLGSAVFVGIVSATLWVGIQVGIVAVAIIVGFLLGSARRRSG